MNFLAKHFFDYQSFVNLPHKAVQLHKTPYSEAGVDPSAAWAPKNMQVAGKNMAAPAARANRNNVEIRPGCHRHGRPNKLEFRKWGERHGELKEERIVPHKDKWMVHLDGDFRHFAEESDDEEMLCEPLPRSLKNKTELDLQILVIMTLTTRVEFVTATIKKLKGFELGKTPLIKVQVFDGPQLVDERTNVHSVSEPAATVELNNHQNGPSKPPGSPQITSNHVQRSNHRRSLSREPSSSTSSSTSLADHERDIGDSYLLRISPHRLHCCYIVIQLFTTRTVTKTRPKADKPEEMETFTETHVEPLGCCIIGPTGAPSRGQHHWRQMVRKHGHPVCMWHRLISNRAPPPTSL